jgi:uncharacterized membrane protein
MKSGLHEWVLFLGRFHPTLVHLPIGGLVLLVLLELLAGFRRFQDAASNNRLILGLTALAAIITAALGWMLSHAGGYDPQLLLWHKWTGFAVAAACALTWSLNRLGQRRAYRLCLLGTLAVLVIASHLGASITHGRGFLTQHAPWPLRGLLGANRSPAAAPKAVPDLAQRSVFTDLIHPILERRCATCHGPEKHKAEFSVESYATLLKGGKDGPVLVPGKALDSAMICRLLLPLDDDDHMPPQSKPQPTLAEIAALQWWIACGAPVDKTVGDLKPGPEIQRILSAAQAPPPSP